MKAIVRFTCVEGAAKVYSDRGSKGNPLAAGNSVDMPVAELSETGETKPGKSFKDAVVGAFSAPGIGGTSGKVMATAVNVPLLVTQYLDKDHFLNPDAEETRQHPLDVGESVTVNITNANVLTLIVENIL